MKPLTIMLAILLLSCSPEDKKHGLFDDLSDKQTVVIYLSKYGLDSVPKDIGKLSAVKNLHITIDSINGWTIHPPLSALQKMTDDPPFRQLPNEITELTNLQSLGLEGLHLKTLPDNFDKLQGLDSLNLMLNKLTIKNEVDKLKGLKSLRYLALHGNKVDSADIAELKGANPRLIIESGLE